LWQQVTGKISDEQKKGHQLFLKTDVRNRGGGGGKPKAP